MKLKTITARISMQTRILVGFLITLITLGSVGWFSIKSLNDSVQTERLLAQSSQTLAQIQEVLQLLRQAETGHYAYVIRNDAVHLESYNAAVSKIGRDLDNLKRSFAGRPDQTNRLQQLEPLVWEKLEIMSAVVQRHRHESSPDQQMEDFDKLDLVTSRIIAVTSEMQADERRLLSEHEKLAEASAARARAVIVIGFALAIAIASLAKIVMRRDFQVRQKTVQLVEQLQSKARIDTLLSQMTNLLQSCLTLDEASTVVSHYARQLFPNDCGTLYVFRSSRNLLEVAAEWGESQSRPSSFAPNQCWGLRQGQTHHVNDPKVSITCSHVRHSDPYICLPMMAYGEVLALLHVQLRKESKPTSEPKESQSIPLRVFTEHMALALSNLNLRITLRQQSIRDPLTGLFNRRYLEETLTLETDRSKRDDAPFSVIMLDLDHFKRFNDTHGHEAGDAVLQTVGRFVQKHVRGGDIACRYGGEEFTMILPGANLQTAYQRAEEICDGVRTLRLEFRGQLLGPLTLSVGVASFPEQGETGENILQAADKALYRAKHQGRDRVILADAADVLHARTVTSH